MRPAPNWRARSGHVVTALVSEWLRRHGDEDVVGQQGYQRLQIGQLPGAGEHGHDRVLGGRACDGRRLVAGGGLPALQAGAGSFQGAVDRLDGHLQHAGHLAGVEAKDVAKDEDGELARRKQLQGGHEGQRDRFALLVAGLRPERPVDGALDELVRKRLQPDGLVARGRHGRFEPRHVPLPGRAPTRRTARVEAPVGGDLVQPGAQRGAFLSESADALPGGQHRLLDGVLSVGEGAEHPVAVHLQLPPVRLRQLPESLAIPARARESRSAVTILRTFLPHHVVPPPGICTAHGANWAARGSRVFPGAAVLCTTDRPDDPPTGSCRAAGNNPGRLTMESSASAGRGVRRSRSAPPRGPMNARVSGTHGKQPTAGSK